MSGGGGEGLNPWRHAKVALSSITVAVVLFCLIFTLFRAIGFMSHSGTFDLVLLFLTGILSVALSRKLSWLWKTGSFLLTVVTCAALAVIISYTVFGDSF
jgi:glucan phosphoethanolaminetransferase (alkaline phosphatase superfamily)